MVRRQDFSLADTLHTFPSVTVSVCGIEQRTINNKTKGSLRKLEKFKNPNSCLNRVTALYFEVL